MLAALTTTRVSRLLIAAVALPLVFLSACSSPPTRLALIGGGLEDDNSSLIEAAAPSNAHGVMLIVPWASGDQAGAANNALKTFGRSSRPREIVICPDPRATSPEAVLATLAILSGPGDVVYFTGGDQKRIVDRLLVGGKPNAIFAAMRRAFVEQKVQFGGTSAGAACMSDPMFLGGSSDAALAGTPSSEADPDAAGDDKPAPTIGARLGPGMGLAKGVLIDTHFLERGRLGRLIAALEQSGVKWGIGFNENRGASMVADTYRFIGEHAAVVVDARDLRREGLDRLGARVSLLGTGDQLKINALDDRVDAWFALRSDRPSDFMISATPPKAPSAKGPWAKNEVLFMLQRLAINPAQAQTTRGDRFTLTLSADDRTRIFATPDGNLCVQDVRADIRATR